MVKKEKGLITVLQIVNYKDGNILIRKLPKDIYEWIVMYKGSFYSSYIIITPVKDQKELTSEELSEVVKLLYAGAASTIDFQRGDKLSKKDKDMFKMFEKARKSIGGQA